MVVTVGGLIGGWIFRSHISEGRKGTSQPDSWFKWLKCWGWFGRSGNPNTMSWWVPSYHTCGMYNLLLVAYPGMCFCWPLFRVFEEWERSVGPPFGWSVSPYYLFMTPHTMIGYHCPCFSIARNSGKIRYLMAERGRFSPVLWDGGNITLGIPSPSPSPSPHGSASATVPMQISRRWRWIQFLRVYLYLFWVKWSKVKCQKSKVK